MSSAGRKKKESNEFYPTPSPVVEALLCSPEIRLPEGVWIEPCAGTGNIIAAVNRHGHDVRWIVNELDESFDPFLKQHLRSKDTLVYGEFVHMDWPYPRADVLIMNPPFSLTMKFILAGLERARMVICLQRQNWFGSKERAPFLQRHCPDIAALPFRPSFRPDGQTDSVEYSWFIWRGQGERRRGKVLMLRAPEDIKQRSLF